MRTATALVTAAATGLAVIGLGAVAANAAADGQLPWRPHAAQEVGADRTPGFGPGGGMGGYRQGMGGGMGGGRWADDATGDRSPGRCMDHDDTDGARGTLTSSQQATLASMAEEEKLAHDLYVSLADKYPGLRQFSRIATAESRHLAAVRSMLSRYGLNDPTAGKPAGQFSDPAVAATYSSLLAGATSESAALAAGVRVEQVDIADLQQAIKGLDTAPDVQQLYTHLLAASRMHQRAFGG